MIRRLAFSLVAAGWLLCLGAGCGNDKTPTSQNFSGPTLMPQKGAEQLEQPVRKKGR